MEINESKIEKIVVRCEEKETTVTIVYKNGGRGKILKPGEKLIIDNFIDK